MKILIELPTWLGDAVMATPAIENIVSFFNDSEITLIGSFVAIEVMKNHPKVTKHYVLDKNYLNLYSNIKSFGDFDAFFSFRSSFRSKFIKFWISAKNKYQFNKFLYSKGHQVEKYNNFINYSLNLNKSADKLVVHNKYKYKYKYKDTERKLLGINPGASYGRAKQWYPKKFAKVATELSNQYDIIIFGGSGEKAVAADIEKYLIENGVKNYRNLAAKTNIQELMNCISNLDLFITGDSGPMHLAAAFKVPTVTIFGPTKSAETSQWMNQKSEIVKKNLKCQPCMQRDCPLMHHNCMKQIQVVEVLKAVIRLD